MSVMEETESCVSDENNVHIEDNTKDVDTESNVAEDETMTPIEDVPLSKNQIKKMRKKEKWQQVKASKRKAEKERYKARKRECIQSGGDWGPTRKQLSHNKMSKSSCKIKVAIDCDFDDFMMEKDIKMLVKQIQFSYSANRRAENPLQFYCCGISGKTSERLESLADYKGWDINFHSESYMSLFESGTVVYLSSESPNILQTLEEDKVYIIGGLVDHNHHKGLCHRLAEDKGIPHAQLPISQYVDMKTRKVLTINHVFEILLHYTVTKDWQKAIYHVLPPRKGAVPKLAGADNSSNTEDPKEDSNSSSEADLTCKGDNPKSENIETSEKSEKDAENPSSAEHTHTNGKYHNLDKQLPGNSLESDKQELPLDRFSDNIHTESSDTKQEAS